MNINTIGIIIFTPGGSKEVNDSGVCARHWFWHSLVRQFSSSIKVKHLGRTRFKVQEWGQYGVCPKVGWKWRCWNGVGQLSASIKVKHLVQGWGQEFVPKLDESVQLVLVNSLLASGSKTHIGGMGDMVRGDALLRGQTFKYPSFPTATATSGSCWWSAAPYTAIRGSYALRISCSVVVLIICNLFVFNLV